MFVETIQSKRGGFSMRSVFLQTGLTNSKWRPWISVCSTHDSLFQSRRRECPRTAFISYLAEYIKTWKNKGYQIILMGDIFEFI